MSGENNEQEIGGTRGKATAVKEGKEGQGKSAQPDGLTAFFYVDTNMQTRSTKREYPAFESLYCAYYHGDEKKVKNSIRDCSSFLALPCLACYACEIVPTFFIF